MVVDLLAYVAWICACTLPGVLFAVPSLIPAVRMRAKQSLVWRRGLRFTLSGTSLLVMLVCVAWLYASVDVVFYGFIRTEVHYVCTPPDGGECPMGIGWLENADEVRHELWVRNLLPPIAQTCFTGNAGACTTADQIQSGHNNWLRYGTSWLSAFASALMTFWLVGRATMPDRKRKPA